MRLGQWSAEGTVESRTQRRTVMFGNTFAAAMVVAALSSIPGFAQEENVAYKNDVAVQAFGSFVKTTTQDGIQQSATNSGGVLSSYRFFFNNNHGVEMNYGYSLNTQNYAGQGVTSYSHEASAAYIFRLPRRHWTPFALAGVGGLVFDPKDFAAANRLRRGPRSSTVRAPTSVSRSMSSCAPNIAGSSIIL